MKNLNSITPDEMIGLSDEKALEIYNNLVKKDKYNLLEDLREFIKCSKSPEDIKEFLAELIEINQDKKYGIYGNRVYSKVENGFMYENNYEEFSNKIRNKILPIIADYENNIKGKTTDLFKNKTDLIEFVVESFIYDICSTEHEVNLENDLKKFQENSNDESKLFERLADFEPDYNGTEKRFNRNTISNLSDEQALEIYNNLVKKDKYDLLEDMRNHMGYSTSGEDLREFFEDLVDISNYGIELLQFCPKNFENETNCKKFLDKAGDKIFLVIADSNIYKQKRQKEIEAILQDPQKLAEFIIEGIAYNTSNQKHEVKLYGIDLSKYDEINNNQVNNQIKEKDKKMKNLDDLNHNNEHGIKISNLSDEKINQLYTSLEKRDEYKLLDDVRNHMGYSNAPQGKKEFLKELLELNEYGFNGTGTQGFIYQEDCKKFIDKIGDKLFPIIANHEEQFENRIAELFKDQEKLARLTLGAFAHDTCRIEHGINLLEKKQSIEISSKPKPKAIEKPIIEQGRGR